jgi:hypothetical protein
MKSFITLAVLLAASTAFAQLRRTGGASTTDYARDARKMAEAQTEVTILEKLEESRLADERNRRAKFESVNFNMVQDPNAAQANF